MSSEQTVDPLAPFPSRRATKAISGRARSQRHALRGLTDGLPAAGQTSARGFLFRAQPAYSFIAAPLTRSEPCPPSSPSTSTPSPCCATGATCLAERRRPRPHRACRRRAWADRPSAARRAAHAARRPAGAAGPDRRRVPWRRVQHRGLSERGFPARSWKTNQPDQVTLVPGRSGAGDLRPWLGLRRQSRLPAADRAAAEEAAACASRCLPTPIPRGSTPRAQIGADRVELYTGPYGSCHDDPAKAAKELERLGKAADAATRRRACRQCRPRPHGRQSAGAREAHSRASPKCRSAMR